MEDSQTIILIYESKQIEIPLPNNYKELFNLFIDKFKIDENTKKLLKLTYNDGEDDIWLEQEEGYNNFKNQIKENLKNNQIKGYLSRESRVSIDKDFFLQFENMQKALISTPEAKIKKSLGKSFEESINIDINKEDNINSISFVQNYLYSNSDNDNENKENEGKNGETKTPNKEKYEENLKSKFELQQKNYNDKIYKLDLEIKQLIEEKNEKALKLLEYEKTKKQEKKYIEELEKQKIDYKNEIDKINLEIKTLKEEKIQKELNFNEFKQKMLEQEENYKSKLKLEEKKYNIKVDEFKKEIEKLNEEKKIYNLKLEDYKKRIEEYNKNNCKENKKLLEEKINKLENNEKELNKEKNKILNKNRELENKLKNKENMIKEYEEKLKDNEERSSHIILEYKEKNNKFIKEIQDYKKKLESLEKNEKEINNLKKKEKELIKENKKDKDKIAELEEKYQKNIINDKNKIDNFNYIENNFSEKSILIQNCLEQQSKEYKNELNKIKNEFKNDLIKKCDEKIKNKYDNIIYNNIYYEINYQSEIILNNYLMKLEEFENKRKNDFSKIINNSQICLDVNATIHDGIKCNNCSQKPIIGERYQCSKCENYNLCKKCEEENSTTLKHKHNFIKIRYIIEDNKKRDDKKDGFVSTEKKYSFKIEDKKDLYLLYNGTKTYQINFKIRNDSEFEYPDNTIIKVSDKSKIKPIKKEIKIKKLKQNEIENIILEFNELKYCKSNNNPYNSIYNLEINGEKIGDEIIFLMNFLDTKDFELVEQFKKVIKNNNIELPIQLNNDYIVKLLKKNSCNFEMTLSNIFENAEKYKNNIK